MNKKLSKDEILIASKDLIDELLDDQHRPKYHFAVPGDFGLPGDPNGAFYAKGKYHLMYLYKNRKDGFRWGHMSSHDLLHWRFHKDALIPSDNDGGVFSGGAFVDDDGKAYLTFWQLPKNYKSGMRESDGLGISIAVSDDHNFEKWTKYGYPIIPSTKFGVLEQFNDDGKLTDVIACADPSNIWKKDGKYYLLTGNLLVIDYFGRDNNSEDKYRGDFNDLFESEDLKTWKHLHRFYKRNEDNMWTQLGEDNMCSSFLPLPSSYNGGECSGKYLLLFISHNKGCQYYIGEYKDNRFYPESHGRMAFADKTFFAPEALIDGKGRQIMWTWLNDKLPDEESRFYWSGVFSLPRVLWYENGELRYAPAQELENLRINKIEDTISLNKNNQSIELKNFDPDCCEINFEAIDGLKLIISNKDDNNQYSEIYYDYGNKCLVVDTTKSGAEGSLIKESVTLILNENESCNVRLFIDKSVIEVFANSKVGITRRLFTSYQRVITLESATHIGEVTVTAYELMATNPF